MTRMKWVGILAGGTVLLVTALWAFRTTPEVQVERAPVTAGPVTRFVLATGTMQSATTVAVGTQVSGVVQSLEADFNSVVHEGQIVARLDPSTYDAQLREAKATLAQAEADAIGLQATADDAQAKLTRAADLAAQQIITASDLEDARATLDEASAALHAGRSAIVEARAAVAQASDDLDHTIIRSPIDGIVTERDVDVGQTLTATVQAPLLFMIASDLSHLQVVVQVDESDVAGLTEGEAATLTVSSYPDETFHGVLSQLRLNPIAEQTTAATSTVGSSSATNQVATVVGYPAIVDVDNPGERLRPGLLHVRSLRDCCAGDQLVTRLHRTAHDFGPSVIRQSDVHFDRREAPPVERPHFAPAACRIRAVCRACRGRRFGFVK